MWQTVWPLLLVIASNTTYHLISNRTPAQVNPFLSLVVTYLVSAATAFVLYLATSGGNGLTQGLSHLNWTSAALGLAVVGLEAGFLYMYRTGWGISVASLTANLAVAVLLLVIGVLCYHEGMSARQLFGAALCVAGLILVNYK
ncbi:hypothetical protein [Butyricicoccus sp.]|uniref:hypothetical protein n=1 Tax=Butyricicoccus sp. TaxID=2049021 RepID=UPI003F192148